MANIREIDHTNEVMSLFADKVERALTTVGGFVVTEAQDFLEADPRRVDTGRLKNSIDKQYVPDEKAVYIGTDVEYAPYVHDGTSKMQPNKFLRRAVETNADQIKAYIKNELN